ncbi:hypothetical protein SDC9_202097 [bioreactor metagenome]|uniref:Uncharacterized protein n=1 Tax=bioreactor metagenome TaxID=1076179 RepID=A0A645ITE1_9ZZZZ
MPHIGVPGSRRAVDDAADPAAAAFIQVFDRDTHPLFLVGADEVDVAGSSVRPLAVHDDQRRGKPLRPVAEFGRFRPDRHRAAELDALQPFAVVDRQDLQPETAARKLLRQRRQNHIHAALHRIDRIVRRDNHHILLLGRQPRMVAVLSCHREYMCPHLRPDARMMAEYP